MKPLPYNKIARSFLAFWLLIALLVASPGGILPAEASHATQTIGSTEILANPPRVMFQTLYVTRGRWDALMAPQTSVDANAPQLSTSQAKDRVMCPDEAETACEDE